jgi:hypothetical protein
MKLSSLCAVLLAIAVNPIAVVNGAKGESKRANKMRLLEQAEKAIEQVNQESSAVSTRVSRSLLFPTLACLAGVPNPLGPSCVCTEDQLIGAIKRAPTSLNATLYTITLCEGVIALSKPIDITGKNFFMNCAGMLWFTCDLSGGNNFRIFEGAPLQAIFQKIRLTYGNAKKSAMNAGGAMYLTAGSVTMDGVALVGNSANVGGGM